jgi:4a-hydroxytetrahydrobiopterin dehydratase
MKALSTTEIKELLSENFIDWSFDESCITRKLQFKNFVEAFSFMTAVALEAEKINHHPYWSNVYNNVVFRLSTHDANGVTKKDFDLAATIDRLCRNYV